MALGEVILQCLTSIRRVFGPSFFSTLTLRMAAGGSRRFAPVTMITNHHLGCTTSVAGSGSNLRFTPYNVPLLELTVDRDDELP